MELITDAQIAQADADAVAAERARDAAEAALARGGARVDLYRALEEASLTASHAAAKARQLRAEQAEQQARQQERAAVQKGAAKDLAAVVKKLTASQDKVTAAVTAVQEAMAKALTVLAEHDQLVRAASADLRARGLRLDDEEETGGGRDGSLHANGEVWSPIDGPSLLAAVAQAAVAAVHPRHPLARVAQRTCGGPGAARGQVALLARLEQAR